LKQKPEWYVDINPVQEVPTLQFDDGRKLFESLIIAEYLDASTGNNRIIPADPFEYAHHKLIVHWFSKIIPSYYKLAFKRDMNAGSELNDLLSDFAKNLKDDFFGGFNMFFLVFLTL
jgi:glutathione S-transferase